MKMDRDAISKSSSVLFELRAFASTSQTFSLAILRASAPTSLILFSSHPGTFFQAPRR